MQEAGIQVDELVIEEDVRATPSKAKHMKWPSRLVSGMLLFTASILAAGCASTPKDRADRAADDEIVQTVGGRIMLGDAARQIAPETGGLILMHGIEARFVSPIEKSKAGPKAYLETLAAETGCAVQYAPHYAFVYPPGYEILLGLSIEGRLAPERANTEASMAFGSGTPLFRVCAVLSRATGTTIVADNILGGAVCGEISLEKAPLTAILEAALKSARVAPDAFQIDDTPEYVLIRAADNVHGEAIALDADARTPDQNARLDQPVNVVLPYPQPNAETLTIPEYALRLRDALPGLSAQLGMPIDAEPALLEFPVNPLVLCNVRARTAIELLIRQWPVQNFGYEMTSKGILLRDRNTVANRESEEPKPPDAPDQTAALAKPEVPTAPETPKQVPVKKTAKRAVPKESKILAPERPAPAPEQPAPAPEQPAPAPEQPAAPAPAQPAAPAPEQPAPAPEQPAPASEQPAPAPEQPVAAPEQPAPAPEHPAPAPEQPAPTHPPEQPTPAPEPPAPTPEQPAAAPEQPAPEQPAPAPTPEQPAPAPAPAQPAPAPEQPAPAPEQPAPAPEQPTPAPQQPAPAPAPEQPAPAPEQPAPAPEQPAQTPAPEQPAPAPEQPAPAPEQPPPAPEQPASGRS